MEFKTLNQWDARLWNEQVGPIYHKAFDGKGAKPEKIIRNMFRKQLCYLHIGIVESHVVAMGLTGKLEGTDALIIDYLTVASKWQHRGIGLKMMNYISDWALTKLRVKSLVIEVESADTPETLARNQFWEKCGFTMTDYIHDYIWVPESYRAMYVTLVPDTNLPKHGEELFKYIERFHKASYQGA
ncbi:GNAT family N-acetyltransferase [Bacillus sp. sid0103]|uniref:GNAT family N-acetyltransferase n=1 Tax=Bacillus sp. sid0103 TaxID=2856337 RepID=UPI001C477965|nr:GNAT family N-acetyltransferase [Bacillus sp. sid0103]MBV7506585.1 GNAT family N-acetyltransferase [Bacillus sp. sid0103]